ncbi:hypothetical protein L596_003903 [Steinernema carpocapsae]|uniref:Uncharacterized protein n=1 Tax=Steinernema carpocapsae TaxID=34508 RepID=A0A4U8UVM1_STECR|nr:hypothetical protein L596_003903 [Steinernema carpocapsae]
MTSTDLAGRSRSFRKPHPLFSVLRSCYSRFLGEQCSSSLISEPKFRFSTRLDLVMINNVLLVTATTLFVSAHASGHFMREPIKRPICAPSESCLTTGFGFRFGVCDCPGENPTCPENNPHSMVQHNEFNYHFCKPRHLALCKKGEIATSVIGIKMQMHCLCPEGDEFLAQPVDAFSNVINYVCGQNSTNAPTAKELNSQWSSMIMTNYQHWKDQQTEENPALFGMTK